MILFLLLACSDASPVEIEKAKHLTCSVGDSIVFDGDCTSVKFYWLRGQGTARCFHKQNFGYATDEIHRPGLVCSLTEVTEPQ